MAANASSKKYPSHLQMPTEDKQKSINELQPRLADAIDLKLQIKQAHWNVKGPQFIALHELFDKIAEEANEYVDNIAERINQLGGVSLGTLQEAAKRTSLTPYPTNIANGKDHVEALSKVLGQFAKLIRDSSAKIDEHGDTGSTDVLDGIADDTEKWLWFVESHTQAES